MRLKSRESIIFLLVVMKSIILSAKIEEYSLNSFATCSFVVWNYFLQGFLSSVENQIG